jgi:hypothetical protein
MVRLVVLRVERLQMNEWSRAGSGGGGLNDGGGRLGGIRSEKVVVGTGIW